MLAITSVLSVHVGAGGQTSPRHLAIATSAAGNVMVVTFSHVSAIPSLPIGGALTNII